MKQIALSLDISRCSACLTCVVACLDQNDLEAEKDFSAFSLVDPFEIPRYTRDGKKFECDLCQTRVTHDLLPACVLACPARALKVEILEDFSKQKIENPSLKILRNLDLDKG